MPDNFTQPWESAATQWVNKTYSLIVAILIIRLMNLRNKKEKIYFLAKKYVHKPERTIC